MGLDMLFPRGRKTTVIQSYAAYLVLPSMILIFSIGYYLGSYRVKHERAAVLKSLSTILQCAGELSHDVDSHNTELADMGRTVEDLDVSDELGQVQNLLLGHINNAISSNKKLEDDLVCARYTLDTQAQELDKTRKEARTDQLSQVGNRKAFNEALNYRLSKWKRLGSNFVLVIIDVDHFKWVNDTHGHLAGDCVVNGVGTLLTKFQRPNDYVARYGGDEFALLLENENLESTIDLCEKIRTAAETENFSAASADERVAITFSMGLAVVKDGDTPESLVCRADAKVYEAKNAGRNRLRFDAGELKDVEDVQAAESLSRHPSQCT